jgi:ATP-dependent Clp protease ATP-binding subunit ClpA
VEEIRSELSLPTTKRAQRALALAGAEALKLRASPVHSEHLLLGILAERGGVAAKVLQQLGIEIGTARAQVRSGSVPGALPDDSLDHCLERAEAV